MNTKRLKTEFSTGGLIVARSGSGWRIVLMRDKANRWTFPKGKIEKGETLLTAAKREIAEEVGITNVSRIGTLPVSHYWYYRKGKIYKTVRYFVFLSKTMCEPKPQKEEGITEATWVSISKATHMIGYPKTNIVLLRQAHAILSHL